jgi:putative lipoic acid-binding regulatory protein
MRGVEFDRIDIKGKHQIGVIAQEIEEIVPELVTEYDNIKSVSYGNITALLIEAIKEQQDQINNLKKEVEELKK